MAPENVERNKMGVYKKPMNMNIGIMLFIAVFFYMAVYVVMSWQTKHVVPYEVREGSLAVNYTYRALALREEQIVTAENSGYISFFAREGERVALGDLVYIVDETGELKEYLDAAATEDSSLSKEELIEVRSDIVNFMKDFDVTDFSEVYDFKYNMKGEVMKFANEQISESIAAINGSGTSGRVNYCNAINTGIVTYYTDGFEAVTPQEVTKEMFDENNYTKTRLQESELIEAGDTVYKLSKNENWSLIMPIETDMAEDFQKEGYIKVRFLKNQYESWGQVFIINGTDGNTYLQLLFNNSMITFAKDRFVDIELLLHDETGLKIPNTSIVTKDFYLIPGSFIKYEGDKSTKGTILRKGFLEDGTPTTDETEIEIYSYNEETDEYYIDTSILSVGEDLIGADQQETYNVGRKGSLVGVYYMNKGYADFRQIQILYQNDEYSIVKSNTDYGLNVYDYVVLNAESVTDEQFIYN